MSAGPLPHSQYRPADLPWIDRIPAHWETSALKQLASVQLSNVDKLSEEGEQPVLLCNYVDVYKHDFIRAGHPFMPATAKPSERVWGKGVDWS
jgi:type I restriction enzyme S subunit